MIKNKTKDHIEVSVRARPLNIFENRDNEETAWEIKPTDLPDRKVKNTEETQNDEAMNCMI